MLIAAWLGVRAALAGRATLRFAWWVIMSKPILRVAKMKRFGRTCPQAVDSHLSRSVDTHNADPARTAENRWIVGGPGVLTDRINTVLLKAGINTEDLRKDATIANDILLSISPDFFRPTDPDAAGTWEPEKLAIFEREATAFLKEQFGERLACAVLHLDESTPHIQAVVVPIIGPKDQLRLSGKAYFDPARLTGLQDAWEKRLARHGVSPRTKGSTARHTTIKTYYSGLQAALEVPLLVPPSPPPLRALLPGGGDFLAAWQAEEVQKVKKRQKPLAQAVAKGMLYDAERNSGSVMRGQMQAQEARYAAIREQMAKTSADLVVSKERIASLRAIPVNEVAAALEFSGDIGKRENAIDFVKRVAELNFEQAVAWLGIAFSPAAAGAAVHQYAATTLVNVDVPVLSKADQVKAAAVEKQLDALGAQSYRITAMHRRDDGIKYAINLCKHGDIERPWSSAEVVAQIPRMTAENARGGNIFLTPLDTLTNYILIDDINSDNIQKLKSDGYSFSAIIQSSPKNYQAVLKVSKRGLTDTAVNEFFKSMNREVGDARITNPEHAMRLAGFQNRKTKYEQENGYYPFVKLVEVSRAFCAHTKAVISGMVENIAQRSGALAASAARTPSPRQ